MRFIQTVLLPAFVLGLAQGLALPEQNTAVEATGVATEFGNIVTRAFTCPAKGKSQCTQCPKAPKKATKGKCPKGKKGCKRSEETPETAQVEQEQEYNNLEARVDVPMDSIGVGSWKDGELLESPGLSACSAMAVYDKTKWAMTHIPPARGANGQLSKTGIEVINEYKEKMTARSSVASMKQPRGFLLMSTLLDDDKREALRKWFRDNNVPFTEEIYSPDNAGSGNLVISRETKSWPPLVSFA